MNKQVLQIEYTSSHELKGEILQGVRELINEIKSSDSNEEKLLTREEAADMLSVSLVTLWKWTKNDIVPAFKIGRKVRYKKQEILASLEKMNKYY